MRNFWDRPPTIRVEYYQCYDKALALQHFKLYLINSTIVRDYTGKLDFRPFVRTLVKVKLGIYWDTTQMSDSGLAIHRSMQLLSKKVTIVPHNDKWNFNSFFTLKRLASMSPSNRLSELLSSPTNNSYVKTWKNSLNSKNSNSKPNPPSKRRWTMQRLWHSLPSLKL